MINVKKTLFRIFLYCIFQANLQLVNNFHTFTVRKASFIYIETVLFMLALFSLSFLVKWDDIFNILLWYVYSAFGMFTVLWSLLNKRRCVCFCVYVYVYERASICSYFIV